MAFCGNCGTNIADSSFCTACGAHTNASVTISKPPPVPSEHVILDEHGIFISQSRFVSNGQTYAMSGVTSIGSLIEKPSKVGPILAMLLGAFIALLGLVAIAKGGLIPMLVGAAIFALGLMAYNRRKPVHIVMLRTASSEQRATTSTDGDFIQRIIGALNQAVVVRG